MVTYLTVTNIGAGPVPFGYAAHPYLTVGEENVDDVVVTVPAERYLAVDDRLLPVESYPWSEGRPEDMRAAEKLGDRRFDTAVARPSPAAADGRWRARLERGDRWAELWAGEALDWIQVFTGNDRRDLSIAVEPMTCGPNAFNPGPTHFRHDRPAGGRVGVVRVGHRRRLRAATEATETVGRTLDSSVTSPRSNRISTSASPPLPHYLV